MSNPCAGKEVEEGWRVAGQKAAVCSAKKEAETRERRNQILDYYKRGRRK